MPGDERQMSVFYKDHRVIPMDSKVSEPDAYTVINSPRWMATLVKVFYFRSILKSSGWWQDPIPREADSVFWKWIFFFF